MHLDDSQCRNCAAWPSKEPRCDDSQEKLCVPPTQAELAASVKTRLQTQTSPRASPLRFVAVSKTRCIEWKARAAELKDTREQIQQRLSQVSHFPGGLPSRASDAKLQANSTLERLTSPQEAEDRKAAAPKRRAGKKKKK